MFTWICPQCGREVLPSYDQCPSCAQQAKEAAAAVPANVAAAPPADPTQPVQPAAAYQPPPGYQPPPPGYQPPPQGDQPPPPGYQPPPPGYQPPPPGYQPPPPGYPPMSYQQPPVYQQRPYPRASSGLPTWLLTVLFAFAFVGVVLGAYWLVGYLRSPSQAASPPATVESPAAKPAAKTSAVQKYVEISGVRWTTDAKKKIVAKFTVTNHSDADLAGLAGNVTIWGRTQKSEEDAVGTFSFTANVGPQASQEVSAPLNTKLKIYELPDWQNVNVDLQITSPQ